MDKSLKMLYQQQLITYEEVQKRATNLEGI